MLVALGGLLTRDVLGGFAGCHAPQRAGTDVSDPFVSIALPELV